MIKQEQSNGAGEWERLEFDVWKVGHYDGMHSLGRESAQHHRPWQIVQEDEQDVDAGDGNQQTRYRLLR